MKFDDILRKRFPASAEDGVDEDVVSPFIVAFDTGAISLSPNDWIGGAGDSQTAHFLIGMKLLMLGEFDAALNLLGRVDPASPEFGKSRYWISYFLGRGHMQAGDLLKAREVFSQIADRLRPDGYYRRLYVRLQRNLAVLDAIMGDFPAALARLDSVDMSFSPLESFYTLSARGAIYNWNMMFEEALHDYGLATDVLNSSFPTSPRLKARISSLTAEVAAWEGIPLLGAHIFEAQNESFLDDKARYHAALALSSFLRGRWDETPGHLQLARKCLRGITGTSALVGLVDFLHSRGTKNRETERFAAGFLKGLCELKQAYCHYLLPMYIALHEDERAKLLGLNVKWLDKQRATLGYGSAINKAFNIG